MFLLTGPLLEFYKFKIIMLEYPDYSFVIQSYVKYVTVVAYAPLRKKRIISPLKTLPEAQRTQELTPLLRTNSATTRWHHMH